MAYQGERQAIHTNAIHTPFSGAPSQCVSVVTPAVSYRYRPLSGIGPYDTSFVFSVKVSRVFGVTRCV